ncbi:MAG: metalloregulator ArsR/SmtB family transcription factor [Pseudomonadota bacterium]|nr:metalloregulator ArsR/SmtB family transcription factor [Pseudomonadota bacterium]
MANFMQAEQLNGVFHALSDPTRRAVLAKLTLGEASVSDLARDHEIALPTFLRHLGVLEDGGLIATRKRGRVRFCRIRSENLDLAQDWIGSQRRAWNRKLNRLGEMLAGQEGGEHDD